MYALAASISRLLALLLAFHFGPLSLYRVISNFADAGVLAWLRRNRPLIKLLCGARFVLRPSPGGTVPSGKKLIENRGHPGSC
jgi:hypothetical protein